MAGAVPLARGEDDGMAPAGDDGRQVLHTGRGRVHDDEALLRRADTKFDNFHKWTAAALLDGAERLFLNGGKTARDIVRSGIRHP